MSQMDSQKTECKNTFPQHCNIDVVDKLLVAPSLYITVIIYRENGFLWRLGSPKSQDATSDIIDWIEYTVDVLNVYMCE